MRWPGSATSSIALVIWAAMALACSDGEGRGATPPRNIDVILVSIDTLRADHVGAYGYPRPTTPSIDAFSRDAILFENAVVQTTSTLASHASIFTSLLPLHHGASVSLQGKLATSSSPIAEVLRSNGYRTASFNGGVQLDAAYGLDRGFDVYESAQARTAKADLLAGPENRTIAIVRKALAWLNADPSPFFLFVHSYEIHHPYTPDPEHLSLFERGYDGPLPDSISVELLEAINYREQRISTADWKHIINAYDAELRSADAAFGDLLAGLKERGLYHDSLIILTSDHGEEFGEHGSMGWHSHTLFDEQLLVPLVVKLPHSRGAGTVVESQVRSIDIAPTILAATGIEPPKSYRGVDLHSMLRPDHRPRLPAFSMLDWARSPIIWSIRLDGWKLYRGGQPRLYHLDDNADEVADVLASHTGRARRLHRLGNKLLDEIETPEHEPADPAEETVEQLRALGYVE
jgi:arylsulfatase A-like enzyme